MRHAEFVRNADKAGLKLAFDIRPMTFEAATELTVLAPDHPRVLSVIAGACAASDANIVDAQIFTTADGRALDTVVISRAFDNDEDEMRRGKRIAALIEQALEGRIRLDAALAGKRQKSRRRDAFSIEPQVRLDNELSEPLHRHRGRVPRPARASLRPDPHDFRAQPRHRLGAHRDFRRARGRHVLCDGPRRAQDRGEGPPEPHPRTICWRRSAYHRRAEGAGGDDLVKRAEARTFKPSLSLLRLRFAEWLRRNRICQLNGSSGSIQGAEAADRPRRRGIRRRPPDRRSARRRIRRGSDRCRLFLDGHPGEDLPDRALGDRQDRASCGPCPG